MFFCLPFENPLCLPIQLVTVPGPHDVGGGKVNCQWGVRRGVRGEESARAGAPCHAFVALLSVSLVERRAAPRCRRRPPPRHPSATASVSNSFHFTITIFIAKTPFGFLPRTIWSLSSKFVVRRFQTDTYWFHLSYQKLHDTMMVSKIVIWMSCFI